MQHVNLRLGGVTDSARGLGLGVLWSAGHLRAVSWGRQYIFVGRGQGKVRQQALAAHSESTAPPAHSPASACPFPCMLLPTRMMWGKHDEMVMGGL